MACPVGGGDYYLYMSYIGGKLATRSHRKLAGMWGWVEPLEVVVMVMWQL